ncbi:MAG: anhydro-N-acetylmuramic acid kinase [Bermanella sp.]
MDKPSSVFYIGQMSGTSLDGVDTVLINVTGGQFTLVTQHHLAFPPPLKEQVLNLCNGTQDELHLCAITSNALSQLYAQGVKAVLRQSSISASLVAAIGCHGQTVRHMPPQYTVQLINGALLAELTNIDVVCDFRSRDMAATGQGAPLVPAFHRSLFQKENEDVFVVNIGGMANVSFLKADGVILGYDTGPGNVLMDAWCQLHTQKDYDENGEWAATGQVNESLLLAMIEESYFKLPAPKSTGRELFNLPWLKQFSLQGVTDKNVMATLTQLTVNSIAQEIQSLGHDGDVIICGGGALNGYLMTCLQQQLRNYNVFSCALLDLDPQCIEAMAFAWLAQQCIERKPGNVPEVTGALGKRVLGAIYPA